MINNEIGRRIRHIREALNLKQKEFAAALEISAPALSELETGKNKPGFDFLVRIVKRFEVNLYYVIFGEGEMFSDPITSFLKSDSDYGVNINDIREFLHYFKRSKSIQYSVMNFFTELKLRNKDLIELDIEKKEG